MPPFQYRELLSEREILQNKISATAEKTNQGFKPEEMQVKFVQLIGVSNEEIHRASVTAGRRRAFRQEHLDFTKVHAGEGRRLAPGERLLEAELLDVEFDGGWDVTDRQARVDLLAFDER
jgi:hypothetical protein